MALYGLRSGTNAGNQAQDGGQNPDNDQNRQQQPVVAPVRDRAVPVFVAFATDSPAIVVQLNTGHQIYLPQGPSPVQRMQLINVPNNLHEVSPNLRHPYYGEGFNEGFHEGSR